MDTENSFGSRKFVITFVALALLVGAALLAGFIPSFISVFPTLVGGIIGVVSVYMTGNIVNKGVVLNSSGFALQQKALAVAVERKNTVTDRTETIISQDSTGTVVREADNEEGKEA